MKLQTEIDRDAPITKTEKGAIGLLALFPLIVVMALTALFGSGCKSGSNEIVESKANDSHSFSFPTADRWWK